MGSITQKKNPNHVSRDKLLRAKVMAFPKLWLEMTVFSKAVDTPLVNFSL